MTISVSVVVPTCRRPALIERCLTTLLAQRFDPAEFEIIVLDDAAEPHIAALVERVAAGVQPDDAPWYVICPSLERTVLPRRAIWAGEPRGD